MGSTFSVFSKPPPASKQSSEVAASFVVFTPKTKDGEKQERIEEDDRIVASSRRKLVLAALTTDVQTMLPEIGGMQDLVTKLQALASDPNVSVAAEKNGGDLEMQPMTADSEAEIRAQYREFSDILRKFMQMFPNASGFEKTLELLETSNEPLPADARNVLVESMKLIVDTAEKYKTEVSSFTTAMTSVREMMLNTVNVQATETTNDALMQDILQYVPTSYKNYFSIPDTENADQPVVLEAAPLTDAVASRLSTLQRFYMDLRIHKQEHFLDRVLREVLQTIPKQNERNFASWVVWIHDYLSKWYIASSLFISKSQNRPISDADLKELNRGLGITDGNAAEFSWDVVLKKIGELNDENAKKQREIEILQERIAVLQNEVKETDRLTAENETKRLEIETLQEQIAGLEEELKQAKVSNEEKAAKTAKIEKLKKQIAENEKGFENKRNEIAELKKRLEITGAVLEKTKINNVDKAELIKKVEVLTQETQTAKDALEKMREEHKIEIQRLNEERDRQIADYEQRITELEAQIKRLENEKRTAETRIADLESELENEIQNNKAEIQQLRDQNAQIESLQQEIAEKESKLAELMQQLHDHQSMAAIEKEESSRLADSIRLSESEKTELQTELESRTSELDELRKAHENLRKDLEEKDHALQDLHEQCSSDMSKKEDSFASAKSELESEIETVKKELGKVQESSAEKERTIEDLRTRLDANWLENGRLKSEIEGVKNELSSKHKSLLIVKAAAKRDFEARLKAQTEKIDALQKEIDTKTADIETRTREIEELKQQQENEKAEAVARQKEQNEEIERRIAALETAMQEQETMYKKKISELENERKTLQEELEKAQKEKEDEIRKLKEEYDAKQLELNERIRELEAETKANDETEKAELAKTNEDLAKQIEDLQAKLKGAESHDQFGWLALYMDDTLTQKDKLAIKRTLEILRRKPVVSTAKTTSKESVTTTIRSQIALALSMVSEIREIILTNPVVYDLLFRFKEQLKKDSGIETLREEDILNFYKEKQVIDATIENTQIERFLYLAFYVDNLPRLFNSTNLHRYFRFERPESGPYSLIHMLTDIIVAASQKFNEIESQEKIAYDTDLEEFQNSFFNYHTKAALLCGYFTVIAKDHLHTLTTIRDNLLKSEQKKNVFSYVYLANRPQDSSTMHNRVGTNSNIFNVVDKNILKVSLPADSFLSSWLTESQSLYLGPFANSKIWKQANSSDHPPDQVAAELYAKITKNDLLSKKSVLFISLAGPSGSGKTSLSLFRRDENNELHAGFLPYLIEKLNYNEIEICAFELTTKTRPTSKNAIEIPNTIYIIEPMIESSILKKKDGEYHSDDTINTFAYEQPISCIGVEKSVHDEASLRKPFFTGKNTFRLTEILDLVSEKRLNCPTPRNPGSSRTHLVFCVRFMSNAKPSDNGDDPVMVLGDFAGIENEYEYSQISTLFETSVKTEKIFGTLSWMDMERKVRKLGEIKKVTVTTKPGIYNKMVDAGLALPRDYDISNKEHSAFYFWNYYRESQKFTTNTEPKLSDHVKKFMKWCYNQWKKSLNDPEKDAFVMGAEDNTIIRNYNAGEAVQEWMDRHLRRFLTRKMTNTRKAETQFIHKSIFDMMSMVRIISETDSQSSLPEIKNSCFAQICSDGSCESHTDMIQGGGVKQFGQSIRKNNLFNAICLGVESYMKMELNKGSDWSAMLVTVVNMENAKKPEYKKSELHIAQIHGWSKYIVSHQQIIIKELLKALSGDVTKYVTEFDVLYGKVSNTDMKTVFDDASKVKDFHTSMEKIMKITATEVVKGIRFVHIHSQIFDHEPNKKNFFNTLMNFTDTYINPTTGTLTNENSTTVVGALRFADFMAKHAKHAMPCIQ